MNMFSRQRIKNIYLLMIFLIGISSPTIVMLRKDRPPNPFSRLSPLPLLFSVERGKKPKSSGMKIFLITKDGETLFKFDRKFYKKLGGPHRHKVLFLIKLTWTKFLTHYTSANFMQEVFCKGYVNLDYINGEKITSIKVTTYHDQLVYEWKCLP